MVGGDPSYSRTFFLPKSNVYVSLSVCLDLLTAPKELKEPSSKHSASGIIAGREDRSAPLDLRLVCLTRCTTFVDCVGRIDAFISRSFLGIMTGDTISASGRESGSIL